MTLEFTKFTRKPFFVDAIEVTEENIGDLAPLIGHLCSKQDGTHFIHIDENIVPNVSRAYPGFWITKLGDNIRCYSRMAFFSQFMPIEDSQEKQLL